MSLVRRAREFLGAHIIQLGALVMGVEFPGRMQTLPDEDPTISEATDPLHEAYAPMGVAVTAEASAMLSQPAPRPLVSPPPPLRGSLAARAHEERRNR